MSIFFSISVYFVLVFSIASKCFAVLIILNLGIAIDLQSKPGWMMLYVPCIDCAVFWLKKGPASAKIDSQLHYTLEFSITSPHGIAVGPMDKVPCWL